jgi:rRNA maturation endonuclease Nob1
MPSADVVERKRGKWKIVGDIEIFFMCTACYSKLKLFAKFCPECGADMRGDRDVD